MARKNMGAGRAQTGRTGTRGAASRIVLMVVLVIAIALIGGGTYCVKTYYDSRYVSTAYYARVPLDYNVTPTPHTSDSGEDMGTAVAYQLTAYNEAGETQTVEFTVYSPDSPYNHGEAQPQSGDYLSINASQTIVVSWDFIDPAKIPTSVREKLG